MGALPDGRGYELASPQDKNGGEVIPVSNRVRAASDGSAVNFTSLLGFADVRGATIGTEYVAERTGTPGTTGWVAHGITPTQKPLPALGAIFGLDPSYDGDMSSDLSSGVFRSYRPLTDAPDVESQLNLYVRRDLRSPGNGSYELISDPGFPVAPLAFPSFERPWIAGASADFSHVIFESAVPLSGDLDLSACSIFGCPTQLYEWADGTLRLAGVLPDGTAAQSSQAGLGATATRPTPHMISADGSRVFFQAPIGSGDVYMRVNGTSTVQLNTSEKSVRPRESPQGATLWTASADGTRIFFSTGEGLVDGDDDGASDYYMYDVSAPAGHHLTLISRDDEPTVADSANRIIGASEDGHYLYFIVFGQLTAGEDPLVFGLYAWHDGTIRYVGNFADTSNAGLNDLGSSTWLFVGSTIMARVSTDGSHLLFAATNDAGFQGRGGFTGFDHGTACNGSGCRELYVYDADNGQLRCASCDPLGTPPTASVAVNTSDISHAGNISSTSHLSNAMSSDGRWVFFNSPDALVSADVNGRVDAYEYDTVTDRVALLSSGRSPDNSYFLDSSASGRDVFFVTSERLVGWDSDGSYDLYDARVGGGLPEPVTPPSPCAGEACQGAVPPSVTSEDAGSSAFHGKGALSGKLARRHVRHKRCKHGRRRVVRRGKVRCVRRKGHGARAVVRARVEGGVGR